MVRIRSCRLTAEINGGRWKRAPVKVSRALANCASPPGSLSCSRITQTYSFPAPCCDLTSRVARSMQTIRHPVTLGSRVPLWPVFSTRNIRFTHATTSWLEGLEGLSRLMTPEEMYDFKSRFKGVQPHGMGVKCPVLTRTIQRVLAHQITSF